METYLVKHAIENVWCNPEQDNQLIFKACKITKPFGELNRFKLMNRNVVLPKAGKRYHVYQIGQLHPKVIGLLANTQDWYQEKWFSFSDVVNQLKLFVSIYTTKGLCLPLYKSHYMFTNERDLIFAIEIDNKLNMNYELDAIYFRFYTNAYYQSYRADATNDYLYTTGRVVSSVSDILAFQNEFNTYSQKPGFTYVFKNGVLIDRLDLISIDVNDVVEIIYDSSVKKVVNLVVSDLLTFSSILDDKFKYLLHPEKDSESVIDYQDDIDIFITYIKDGRNQAYYYHRNNIDSHRMVTHRDYSIVVDYFEYIANALSDDVSETPLDLRALTIQIIVKKSGYHRPLIFDNNRIFELYKLSDEKILRAMIGIDSLVPEWKAENLENSAYTTLMRDDFIEVDIADIQKAYGYNGISKVVGNTPVRTYTRGSLKQCDVPVGLQENATAYEYDGNGNLLGYYYHVSGSDYECTHFQTEFVEMISGKGTKQPTVIYGTDNLSLPTYHNYRVYMTFMSGNIISPNWIDITGGDLYRVENNTLIWNNLYTGHYLMIRSDQTFLAYDLELEDVAGTYYFTLSELVESELRNGEQILPVPLGELDIFLNGKSAIKGLDYIVQFPKIYIVNKAFLIQPANTSPLNVHVRFTGFCDSELTFEAIDDFGYIEHGVMSNNDRYDIRDDRVLRITLNGQLKTREVIQFSETTDGVSIVNAMNGQPYQIKDIVVPLKQLTNENTYSLRAKSLEIDNRISNYLTIKKPQPERNAVSSIYQRYVLVSPFFTHLIFDLYEERFNSDILITVLSDNDIVDICREYEFLLAFDPINSTNEIDTNYVEIHPHCLNTVIPLTIYQYRFLLRVVKLYGNNCIDIASFVSIQS